MIQNPNIKFSDRDTYSSKDTSPNSHFIRPKISPKNLDSRFGENRATVAVLENGSELGL